MGDKNILTMRKFPKIVQSDCQNIQRIDPLKQKQAAGIYDIAKKSDIVRRVILFGSSVTGKCHAGSDLDVCIDADITDGMKIYELQKQIGNVCDWNCDILMFSNIGDRLKKTIEREGVVIYE